MSQPANVLRAKLLIQEYGPLFVALFAIVGAAALGTAAWSYTHPPTTTVTDRTDRQTVSTALETSATVTQRNDLYDRGTVLRDQPVYLFAATPNATLRLRTAVPEGQAATVDQRLVLVLRGVRDGDVFWTETQTLASGREKTTDGTASVSVTVDARSLRRRVSAAADEIGSAGNLEVKLRANVSYETSRYTGEQVKSTGLSFSDTSYTVGSLSAEKTHGELVTREIVVPTRDATAYTLPGALGALSLIAAAGVAVAYARRDEWADLERRLHRSRYADWISAGELPLDVGNRRISLQSLEDLVDVAIDANKRVVHDRTWDVYAVVDGDVVYYYADGDHLNARPDDPLAGAESNPMAGPESDPMAGSESDPMTGPESDEFIWENDMTEGDVTENDVPESDR